MSDVGKVLLEGGYLSAEDLDKAKRFADRYEADLVEHLIDEGLISKSVLAEAMAEAAGLPVADTRTDPPSAETVRQFPQSVAEAHRVILLRQNDLSIAVATDRPDLARPWMEVFEKANPDRSVELLYALPEDIDRSLALFRPPLEERVGGILGKGGRFAPNVVGEVFGEALTARASDIHFEPREFEVVIRFRVDGVLREAMRFPKTHYESVLNHIKLSAKLHIDEHAAAQDGAIRYEAGRMTDMRVSVAPTLEGEKVTVRILSEYIRSFNLSGLGLGSDRMETMERAIKSPFGMIIVAGPTGSGKTTTLYALLKTLDHAGTNVTTIEDPVEYKIAGINQIQVNAETGLTFAKGLRSIVRQDPDVILLGEIRDEETAEIAVNAALTGHLLLSTFHANDAASVVPRLIDMGTEPFLLASTLEAVVAQRLVRKICTVCRVTSEEAVPAELAKAAGKSRSKRPRTVYRGKGCMNCGWTGYHGRTAIFEIIRVTPKMQDLVLKRPSAKEILALARKEGMTSMFEDGLRKVENGITTVEELRRVSRPYEL